MSKELQPFGDDPFFGRFFGEWPLAPFFADPFFKSAGFPKVDIEEKEKEIIVKLDLPGVDPKDANVELQHNHLLISGASESKEEVKRKHYYRKERSFGSFQRQISLPCEVSEKGIFAKAKDGVLTITLPKKSPETPGKKRIPIES